MSSDSLLVFELNEVPYKVLDDFVRHHPRSNFAKLLGRSAQYTTICPDKIHLHPRISWQTFHRGVPDTKHGIVEYNQDATQADLQYPRLLDLLRKEKIAVGCGASIGSYPVPKEKEGIAFWLPDPFAGSEETYPAYVRHFQRLNLRAVKKSGRVVRSGLNASDVGMFLLYAPILGVSLRGYWKGFFQLVSEIVKHERIVRRRTLQSMLTFSVVFRLIKKKRPRVATFFSNHVASSMHRYWAAKFQDDYEQNNMPQSWRNKFGGEIDFAMEEADYMLGKFMRFVMDNPDYKLLCVGSMGQYAIPHEVINRQIIITDTEKWMRFLGFSKEEYTQAGSMEPQYIFGFENEQLLKDFVNKLAIIRIGEKPPYVKVLNATQVVLEVAQINLPQDVSIYKNAEAFTLMEAGLKNEVIQDMVGSTAQHIPEGICIIFPASQVGASRRNMCLTEVTAAILKMQQVPIPAYMPAPSSDILNALRG